MSLPQELWLNGQAQVVFPADCEPIYAGDEVNLEAPILLGRNMVVRTVKILSRCHDMPRQVVRLYARAL